MISVGQHEKIMNWISRSRCNMYQIDRFLVSNSTTYGMSPRFGRPSRRPRLAVFFDSLRAKPMTDSFSAAQTTTFRQVRALLHLDREDRTQSAHQLVRDTAGLFLSQLMTVLRAIPNLRSSPRKLLRS